MKDGDGARYNMHLGMVVRDNVAYALTAREDARLDGAAAAAPNLPPLWWYGGTQISGSAFYEITAGRWTQIATWISASCAPTWPAQQCADAQTRLTLGRASHEADTPMNRSNPPWTTQWINNYSRLLVLVGQVCA